MCECVCACVWVGDGGGVCGGGVGRRARVCMCVWLGGVCIVVSESINQQGVAFESMTHHDVVPATHQHQISEGFAVQVAHAVRSDRRQHALHLQTTMHAR
jgi:hypothetical protein